MINISLKFSNRFYNITEDKSTVPNNFLYLYLASVISLCFFLHI